MQLPARRQLPKKPGTTGLTARTCWLYSSSRGLLISDHLSVPRSGTFAVKAIRTYSMQFEGELARIALERADIPALVVGASPYPGVIGGVQLLVPEDRIEEALKVLKHLEERR
jgi:hypothetical protein